MAIRTAMDMDDESSAQEAAELKVEAIPRIGRAAFMYREPRVGIDGKQYFLNCSACDSYVPESAMMGSVMGARCVKFGSRFPISDDDHCSLFAAWGAGMICEAVVSFNANELRKGIPGAVSPWEVGYVSKETTQCGCCRFGDRTDPDLPMGKVECEAFECLNQAAPNLFALNTTVDSFGGCSLWQEIPDADDLPGGMT